MRRIAIALDLYARKSMLDLVEVGPAQCDRRGADVFLQPMQLGGSRYRYDPRTLCQQPGKRDLGSLRNGPDLGAMRET